MQEKSSNNLMSILSSLLLIVAGIVVFFFVAKILFKIVLWGTLILGGIVLIMNYKLVFRYLKKLGGIFKKSPMMGVGASILAVIGLPILVLVMFGQTLLERKAGKLIREQKAQEEGEFTEYVELDSSRNDQQEF